MSIFLVKCRTCNGNVSYSADHCPHCGEPDFVSEGDKSRIRYQVQREQEIIANDPEHQKYWSDLRKGIEEKKRRESDELWSGCGKIFLIISIVIVLMVIRLACQ